MPAPVSLTNSVRQYQKTYDLALELYSVFDDCDAAELVQEATELGNEADKLREVAGIGWEQCADLGRHLSFLVRNLKRNEKASCAQDVKDIVFSDLPATLRNILATSPDAKHFDQPLRDAVFPLIDGGHLDSAVRKVFVVLTDRLRRAFGVTEEIDGEDLVNTVFGKGGKLPVALDDGKKQAMRNLICGFYGVYRNRFAHNDFVPTIAQAKAILEMANTIILEIEAVAIASAEKG